MEEEAGQDDAQEEGGKEDEDDIREVWFISQFRFSNFKSLVKPDPPANVTNCTDSHVDPSEVLTEPDT